MVCETPEDIHKILALRSASLLEAEADPIVLLQSGERRIERIVVTGITAVGRAACLAYNAMAVPAWPTLKRRAGGGSRVLSPAGVVPPRAQTVHAALLPGRARFRRGEFVGGAFLVRRAPPSRALSGATAFLVAVLIAFGWRKYVK